MGGTPVGGVYQAADREGEDRIECRKCSEVEIGGGSIGSLP